MRAAAKMVGILRSFSFFQDYEMILSKKDWMTLGFLAELKYVPSLEVFFRMYDSPMSLFLVLAG